MLEDVLEIAVARVVDRLDGAAVARGSLEETLDRLFLGVRELAPTGAEDLHAVVLGRVVRRGDDRTEVLGEECHGRRGQHSGEDGGPSRRGDPGGERLLERRPGPARVTSDEDMTGV